ncbi:MAG: hypothetical protein NVS4B7_07350 [Ktedonobacteraceae bacterium]
MFMKGIMMRKVVLVLVAFVTIVGLFALMYGTGTARAAGSTNHYGPFASTSPDGGTCGQPWAQDTFNRFFTVQDNGDGTFTVDEQFKDGTFVTSGPVSPGACETDSHHGSTVQAGVTGTMHGYLDGTVSGGTYNPNGCNANPTPCSTTSGFIAAVFPGGTFTCFTGVGKCQFSFEYAAGGQGLLFHDWKDANDQNGTEYFLGDIANN